MLGVTPDTITFTSLINACSKAQQLEKAFEVIDCMRAANIAPNIFTYTTLIGARLTQHAPRASSKISISSREINSHPPSELLPPQP